MYVRIARDLTEQIAAGKYPVGSLLPKEVDLSEQYGVSRHTMREALRRLCDTGMVSRRRRAGTEVLTASRSVNYRQPVNSIEDLLQYGEGTQVRVLRQARVVCDGLLAEMLDCAEGEEWLRIESVRTYSGDPRPICVTTNYLNLVLPGIEKRVKNFTGRIFAMLETRYGVRIMSIEQSMEAVRLDRRQAKLLAAKAGSPGLRATRRYYDETGRLLELSDAVHPEGRFAYVTRLKRDE
jgi:DNA-binding GntR family transcriptional regulator